MDPAVLERLWDVPLQQYAVAALKIANKDGEVVKLDFTGRPGQIKLADAIERQKALGRPVRIVLVKSRQFGGSTAVQAEMNKRATTRARRKILTVAHRLDTSESLFG
jgi:23S rRNA pseudoU1915 N3-methylase RlmH